MLAKLMNHAWLQLHGFFSPSFNPLNAAGKVVLDDCRIYIKKIYTGISMITAFKKRHSFILNAIIRIISNTTFILCKLLELPLNLPYPVLSIK